MKGSGALALVVLSACARTSLAPSIIRSEPLNPEVGTPVAVATAEGSYLGGELSVTLSAKEGDTARPGLTPFLSINESFRGGVQDFVNFAGGMVFARFQAVELLVGVGRVFSGGTAWNVPLLGVRAGAN